jgi:S1-C subfamily serine protease
VAPSVVSLGQRGGGNGAGVIWRSDGVIVTNRHVVRGDRVDVWTADERHFTGIVAARHPDRDLAVVKVAAEELPAIEVGDSATVVPGQLAIASATRSATGTRRRSASSSPPARRRPARGRGRATGSRPT